MTDELTIDSLDAAINSIKEKYGKPIKEIRIHPDDWHKATDALRKVAELVGMKINVPNDRMWGIPIVENSDLEPGTMVLYYDEKNYVVVKNVG